MTPTELREHNSIIIGSYHLAAAILRAKGHPPPPAPSLLRRPRKRPSRAKPFRPGHVPTGPSTHSIQEVVADYFGISPADLVTKTRKWKIAHPRQIAFYLVRELTPRSLPDIGRRFGGFDHTTVIHGIRQIERRRQYDADLAADVEALRERLAG